MGLPSSGTAGGWGCRDEPGPGGVGPCDRRTTGGERRRPWGETGVMMMDSRWITEKSKARKMPRKQKEAEKRMERRCWRD
ncbi:unnamed protein product [Rangifer tarandus platyrhynchus]|uniref:Uncharacterized protein n=2 Tax=Rangifer tarandus platyrhynchus TaxID=3082113 RepID=A0ABN8XZ43_RANTA|nr:unnamed protein product [Rangifer tarandus platyrhynchus]CAI9713426.1 unnamed protein product [Rangifer tarandus platyrhynchus]